MPFFNSYFDRNTNSLSARIASYEFLQKFASTNHDWSTGISPDSDYFVEKLSAHLTELTDEDFAFLLCHTGFIPEEYSHDSSQETIYTKLVEIVVREWARRIGFSQSTLPKQKASFEDIKISDGKHVIVCDAKSFRLGRSQKAPNVKDALKEGDIPKWLGNHSNTGVTTLGGMVAFPSRHDWSDGSDFYSYLTSKNQPIVCLFYEHMAFMLLNKISSKKVIELYLNYATLFPVKLTNKKTNKHEYWRKIEDYLFHNCKSDWIKFKGIAYRIVSEKVFHTVEEIKRHVKEFQISVEQQIPKDATNEQLREMLIAARSERGSFTLIRQLECISNFRDPSEGYIK